jgi:hypothetical protein
VIFAALCVLCGKKLSGTINRKEQKRVSQIPRVRLSPCWFNGNFRNQRATRAGDEAATEIAASYHIKSDESVILKDAL